MPTRVPSSKMLALPSAPEPVNLVRKFGVPVPVRPLPVTDSQLTVPSAFTVRIAFPAAQPPVTRFCATVKSTFRVTAPVAPPPVSPLPELTAVIVPPADGQTFRQ